MSKPKWTKGPWLVSGEDITAGLDYLATTAYSTEADTVILRANINLIAAAPDLYEALQDFVENGEGCPLEANCLGPQCCKTGRGKAALAKARGEHDHV